MNYLQASTKACNDGISSSPWVLIVDSKIALYLENEKKAFKII